MLTTNKIYFINIKLIKLPILVKGYFKLSLKAKSIFRRRMTEKIYSAVHLIQALLIQTGDYGPC